MLQVNVKVDFLKKNYYIVFIFYFIEKHLFKSIKIILCCFYWFR